MDFPLSQQLREGTKESHQLAEKSPFIQQFFRGSLSREAYQDYLVQLYHVYTALEENAAEHEAHPILGKLYSAALHRKQALADDLTFFAGDDHWMALAPYAATNAYIERIRELSETWVEGLVAHHYTRYLGDLSGGQVLKRIVAQAFELSSGQGVAFNDFPEISDHQAFKEHYRTQLDTLTDDQALADKIVDEAIRAFELNRAVFNAIETAQEKVAG